MKLSLQHERIGTYKWHLIVILALVLAVGYLEAHEPVAHVSQHHSN